MSRTAWSTPVMGLALLLLLFAARLTHSAGENSFTFDEPEYLGASLYLTRTGDYQFDGELLRHQPPLIYHLAKLPLSAFDLETVRTEPHAGHHLLRDPLVDPGRLRVVSRIPFVLIACWGAVLCFFWAREVAGPIAGLFAAFLFSFSPSVLAHGPLVHSDMTVSVLFLQTLYAFWRWVQHPSAMGRVFCGISLGLAALAKLTAILLSGTLALLIVVMLANRRPPGEGRLALGPDSPPLRAAWGFGVWLSIHAIAILVIWIGYGGSLVASPIEQGFFAGFPLPAYLHSLWFYESANALGRPVFFLGDFSSEGWWYFFPVAFVLKEPLGLIALLFVALVPMRVRHGGFEALVAVTFAVYLAVLMLHVRVPLGYRYALPLLPLLFVFIATRLTPLATGRSRVAMALVGLLLAAESLWIHPHYLAYFNVLSGGPTNGPNLMLDSNLDWGQDVTTLARELAADGNPPVWLALFAAEDPAAYGIRGRVLEGCDPVGGMLAISANVRGGLYAPGNPFASPEPGCYDWLDAFEPASRPGYSILLYDLPQPEPG